MQRLRLSSTAAFSVLATAAIAHPGHVEEVAGHSHWATYGAAGLAVLVALGAVVFAWRGAGRRNR